MICSAIINDKDSYTVSCLVLNLIQIRLPQVTKASIGSYYYCNNHVPVYHGTIINIDAIGINLYDFIIDNISITSII